MKVGLLNLVFCFCISVVIAPFIIKLLIKLKFGQSILVYVEKHKGKSGTPTMGGVIFIVSGLIGYFVFYDSSNTLSTLVLFSLIFFGVLGLLDDYIKIRYKQNEGLKPYQKIIGQLGISIIIALFIYKNGLIGSVINLPLLGRTIDIGLWIIPFVIVFFVAVVNSVNLIDGLDGLCGGVSATVIIAISIVVFVCTKYNSSSVYFGQINSMIVVSLGIAGGVLGYLCFNTYPAKVFMGDTGSLALGGVVASMLASTRNYMLIFTIGIAYIVTTISVILQVSVYKIKHIRLFKMAPLHHHFQEKYHENKVVSVYVILTIIVSLLTISIYL